MFRYTLLAIGTACLLKAAFTTAFNPFTITGLLMIGAVAVLPSKS